jgi:hypothetical protein
LARIIVPGAALGVALQLHLLAIAALEIAQPRYVFPAWPLMMGALFVAFCLTHAVFARRRTCHAIFS